MEVYFEPTRGRPFSIEVGYFDTIQEIKEKIEKYQNIPAAKQTLIFKNQTLADDLNIHSSEILDNSHIQLIIAVEDPASPIPTEKPTVNVKEEPSPPTPPPQTPPPQPQPPCSKKIKLLVKMPTTKLGMAMELDVNESIRRLKEKINENEGIPIGNIHVHANGIELHDHKTLHECGLMDHSEIDVSVRHTSPPSSLGASGNVTATTTTTTTAVATATALTMTTMSNSNTNSTNNNNSSSKKLKVMVLTKCGTKKIPVEVNASDNVGELRKELQKVSQWVQFHLPQEGYFFIYNQNVMEEDRSFRWHHVAQGDTIEIFNGSVTGGS